MLKTQYFNLLHWIKSCVFSFPIFFLTGLSPSDRVHQEPADMYKTSEDIAKIQCLQSIDDNHNRILWYKQSNSQLQLLGYMVANRGLPETGFNVSIDGSANKDQTCTLTIKRLDFNSSAVYFCAASYHSATYHWVTIQKPCNWQFLPYSPQPLAPVS